MAQPVMGWSTPSPLGSKCSGEMRRSTFAATQPVSMEFGSLGGHNAPTELVDSSTAAVLVWAVQVLGRIRDFSTFVG